MSTRRKGIDARLIALRGLLDQERPRSTLETACIHRMIRDFEGEGQNGLVWNEDEAVRNIEFCKLLRHWKGNQWAGRRFEPEPWQEQLTLAPLFGWQRETPNGLRRRFTVGYDEEPRKNGKTFKASAVALQGLLADREQGAEVYTAASTRDQASILFRDAQNVIRQSAEIMQHVQLWKHSLTCPGLSSFLKPVSADANTLHGHNIHRAVVDELHTQPNRDLWDVIVTGTGARTNPLVFGITTAGHDRASICWELHEYARMVLEGHHEDNTFFAFISCGEPEDDPFDPRTWAKANPNLDITISSDYLQREANKARKSPSYENTFRRLHLNQWTEQSIRWLPMHVWDECAGSVNIDELRGRDCYAGLDLANTRDVNALVLVFPFDDGRVKVLPVFWVPEESASDAAENDRRQLQWWVDKKLVRTTPGSTIDILETLPHDIMELSREFNILNLAYDPWGSGPAMVQQLQILGFPLERITEFRQTIGNFAAPTKEFERLVIARKLEHGGNEVLRWMASNVAVKTDPSGNMRPDKEKSSAKIDGIVAGIMAVGLMITQEQQANWYVPGSLAL